MRARPCLPLSTRLPRLTRAPAQLLRRAASSQDKGDDPLTPDGDARLDRLWPGRAVTEAEEILASAPLPHGFEAAAPSKKARVFARSLRQRQAAQSANRAFLPLEMSAIIDLFDDYAGPARQLDRDGLRALLASVGERPDDATLEELFHQADVDSSGAIDLDEFLHASDALLASNPARCILVVGGPGSGKGVLCRRLVDECDVSHVSCGDLLRSEVEADTPLGREVAGIMLRGELVSSALIVTLLRRRMRSFGGRRLLLDGFPRSRDNAIDFEAQCGRPELALHLVCDEEKMLERILRRAQTEGRADDTRKAAVRRIAVYRQQSEPTLEWLRASRVPIVELDSSGSREEMWSGLKAIGRLMRNIVI